MKIQIRKLSEKLLFGERVPPSNAEEFEELLENLKPRYDCIEARFQRGKAGSAGLIYGDGQLLHIVDNHGSEKELQEEVYSLMDYYRDLPTLWSGCRGAVAKSLDVPLDKDFNKWFDRYANQITGKHY